MLIILPFSTAICQSVVEVYLAGVALLITVNRKFNVLLLLLLLLLLLS